MDRYIVIFTIVYAVFIGVIAFAIAEQHPTKKYDVFAWVVSILAIVLFFLAVMVVSHGR